LWVAVGLTSKQFSGTYAAAGLSFFFYTLPTVVAPVFVSFVDRVSRRSVYVWTNMALFAWCALLLLPAVHDSRRRST
jgi:MFS family permease